MKSGLRYKEIFLHPGEFYFGGAERNVGTLLGSCIAICLWHPVRRIGGMCHFVLPNKKPPPNSEPIGRYAGGAMKLFMGNLRKRGTNIIEYDAKIFGGANSAPELAEIERETIGERNAQAAMELLMDQGLEIKVADVGETGFRRVIFDLSCGDVWVKRHANNLHVAENTKLLGGITV